MSNEETDRLYTVGFDAKIWAPGSIPLIAESLEEALNRAFDKKNVDIKKVYIKELTEE